MLGKMTRERLSRVLAAIWFVLVAASLGLVTGAALIPNELNAHLPVWSLGIPVVLVVAIVALPLLVVAAVVDNRAKSSRPRG